MLYELTRGGGEKYEKDTDSNIKTGLVPLAKWIETTWALSFRSFFVFLVSQSNMYLKMPDFHWVLTEERTNFD